MEFIGIPAISVISYMITEIFKLFINKKYLPIVASLVGCLLGIVSYCLNINIILASDIFSAAAIGIISGLAATGSNQILKQLMKEGKKIK